MPNPLVGAGADADDADLRVDCRRDCLRREQGIGDAKHAALSASLERIAARVPYGSAQVLPIWSSSVASVPLTAPGAAHVLTKQLVHSIREAVHDDVALRMLAPRRARISCRCCFGVPAPIVSGSKFRVDGKNFLTDSFSTPSFIVSPQDVNQGRLKLQLNVINDNGQRWIDMDFQRPQGSTPRSLAGNANARWQAGPIGQIQLSGRTRLNNIFFYFTVNGVAVTTNLQPIPGQINVAQTRSP